MPETGLDDWMASHLPPSANEEKTSPEHARPEPARFQELSDMVDAVRPRLLNADRLAELAELIDHYGERVAIAALNDGELRELVAKYSPDGH